MEFKKLFSSVALTSFAFFGMAQAADLGFTDDAEIPSWADEAIEELMDQGVVSGNDDGSFAPNRQLNRAEVSKIIVLATGIDMDTTGGPHFPDVEEGAWYYDYIETMYNQGWINGYPDGMFRPGVGINRAEIAKMVTNGFELDQDLSGAPHFDDVASGDWFYGYVETIYNNGCMLGYGDGTFGPGNPVTRAETVKIVYDCQLVALGSFDGVAEGTLEVALSNETPRGTNIPYNATSVPFTTVEITAADDADIEISSMTFTRLGLGDNDDFDNVWLEIDGFKVGNDKSVNNDDVVELRFNPPIVVPAGQTLVADLVASMKYSDTDKNVGHHNRFVLVSADDLVTSAANIAGDFPIEGEEMEVADYKVTQVEFQNLGSDTTIDVGDSFVEIGKFKIENQSTTNKDVEVRALTFKNDGTAELENVLENVALYVSGEQVSAETIIDGDYITFRLDNGVTGGYILEDGDSQIFSVRADIVSAEKGDTIEFKVDNFEDVVGVEIGTAFGVKAVSTTFNAAGATAGTGTCATNSNAEDNCARLALYTLRAGSINISRDPSSLSNQEYAPGSNDVVFLTARIVVDQPVIVDGVNIQVEDSLGIASVTELNAEFDNFRLYLNDKLIDSENDFMDGGSVNASYLKFNTTFEISGTSVLKLVGNIDSSADNGDRIKLSIGNTDFDSPEYISTGDQIETTDIVGSAVASFVDIQQSVLEVSKTDGFASPETVVAGVSDVTFMKFVLDNNNSGDVNVTSITIDADGTGAAATYQNFTAALFVDGVQQGSSRALASASGTVTFNDVSIIIPSAGQKEVELVVDTLESSSNSITASTTVANGAGTTTATGGVVCVAATSVNSTSTVLCAAPGLTQALKSGDTIVINGDNIILTADAAAGATSIQVNPTTVDTDNTAAANIVVVQYPIGATSFSVASADNISVGDTLTGPTPSCVVTAVSGTTITCTSALTAVLPVGTAITETASNDQIIFSIENIDADNVENGNTVAVYLAGTTTPLAKDANDTLATETAGGSTDVDSAVFSLVSSGGLTVSNGAVITNSTNILIANSTDVEIYKLQFSASNDEVEVKDLYFTGNVTGGDRVTFKLYDESGALLATEQMTSGSLHFELGASNRIKVPKDSSTTVTIKVDVKSITQATQTGKTVNLALSTASGTGNKGVDAITASTGSDLATTAITVSGTPASEDYVAYRTMITFANAATQPSFVATGADAGVFRFQVSNDTAGPAILSEVTIKLSTSGTSVNNGNATIAKYSSSAYTGTPTVIGTTALGAAIAANSSADIVFDITDDEVNGTNYYEVRVSAGYTNSTSDNDSITGAIVNNATAVSVSTTAAGVGSGDSIVWSDKSNNGAAGNYMNGFQLILPSEVAGAKE